MKLTFLGTRGEIDVRTKRHRMHTSLLITYKNKNVMIDRGLDWLNKEYNLNLTAMVITHAHDDHTGGLKNGAPCPVYAANETVEKLKKFRGLDMIEIEKEKSFSINDINFTAYPVEHSINAPAVGYKINAGKVTVFYCPDLIYIHNRTKALKDVKIYIGDGATISKAFIRKRGDSLIGHARIREQINWCAKEKVSRAIITHCGSEIVKNDEQRINKIINEIGEQYGVDVLVAYDGMEMTLR